MKEHTYTRGLGLPLVIAIIALALFGSGGAYYSIQRNAAKERVNLEKLAMEADQKRTQGIMMRQKTYIIPLAALGNSNESGEALLEDAGGKAKVTIRIENAPRDVPQPAHIHAGACPTPGAVKYPLTNVTNGSSVTMLSVSVEDVLAGLPLAVNVHKSATEATSYVSCGDISVDGMMDKGDAMRNDNAMMEKEGGPADLDGDGMMDKAMETGGSMMEDKTPVVAEPKVFNITGVPFSFSIKEIRVKKGDTVKVNFTNGQGMHDWVLDEFNVRTKTLSAGQSQTVEFTANKTGTFEYYCSVGNHRSAGMVGKLIVE